MMKLVGLLSKKTSELTVEDLQVIKTSLKIDTLNLTEELKDAAVSLLAGRDIHNVADLIQSPDSVKMVTDLFQGKTSIVKGDEVMGENAFVHQCRHCQNFEIIEL